MKTVDILKEKLTEGFVKAGYDENTVWSVSATARIFASSSVMALWLPRRNIKRLRS